MTQRFLKTRLWADTERIIIGGGFRKSRMGELAIVRADIILKAEGLKVDLVPNQYERFDPVIIQALGEPEPFEWGLNAGTMIRSDAQRGLFEEAAKFGIGCGFTVPIHDGRGPIAAVTFAADEHGTTAFSRRIEEHGRVLQLMAMYFPAHARRKLANDRVVDGVALSPREFECLGWAAQGKTAWEIGRILGVSRRTAAFHLDNAKAKLGVHSICQAVARLITSRSMMQ